MKQLLKLFLLVFLISACGGDDQSPEDPQVNPDYEVTTIGLVGSGDSKEFTGRLDKLPDGQTVSAGFTWFEPSGRAHRFEDVATLTETGNFTMPFGLPAQGPGYTVRAFIITGSGLEVRGRSVAFTN